MKTIVPAVGRAYEAMTHSSGLCVVYCSGERERSHVFLVPEYAFAGRLLEELAWDETTGSGSVDIIRDKGKSPFDPSQPDKLWAWLDEQTALLG
jgi:hypothetical protein